MSYTENEKNNNTATIAELAKETLEPKIVTVIVEGNEQTIMLSPKDSNLHTFDHSLEAPRRVNEKVVLNTINSFIDYIEKFKNDTTVIFGNHINQSPKYLFECALNYHTQEEASFNSHQVFLEYQLTSDYKHWIDLNDQAITQRKFIDFIKDNANTIASPALAALLQSIEKITVKSAGALSKSEGHLSSDSSNIKNTTVESTLPELIEVQLKPIIGSSTYTLKVRPQVLVSNEKEAIAFTYRITNLDSVLDHLFNDLCEKITEAKLELFK